MKSFKKILVLTLIIDVLMFIPVILSLFLDEVKAMLVADMKIEGLRENLPAMEILDTMIFVFSFLALGYLSAVIYTLRLKNQAALKVSTFILGIFHLAWTAPDCINLALGKPHPPLPLLILSIVPVLALFYVSKNGVLAEEK